MAVLPFMLILTLTILMVQLQGFSRLFLVVSVAPLGLIGVVAALLIADKPLGFVALLGVLVLTGMIARNSVILIDQVETEKAHGRHPWDAVVEATTHRFRPILLTAAAAILGMIPIAPTIFWSPMAYAIMGGLAVATLLTLVFLPALYVTWFRVERPQPDADGGTELRQAAVAAQLDALLILQSLMTAQLRSIAGNLLALGLRPLDGYHPAQHGRRGPRRLRADHLGATRRLRSMPAATRPARSSTARDIAATSASSPLPSIASTRDASSAVSIWRVGAI
jgi:hypothetical protein